MGHMVLPLEGFNVENIHKIIYELSECVTVVEVMSRGVLHSVLVTSILGRVRPHVTMTNGTYSVFLLVEHKRSNGLTLVSTRPSEWLTGRQG